MTGSPRTRFLLALLLWGLLAVPARGDELASWFADDPRARAYVGLQAELQAIFAAARQQQVPMGPFIDKLREGAAKGVDGERLLEALRATIDRLVRAGSILERASGRTPGGEEDVQAVSLLLLDGLSEELADGLIAAGLRAGRGMPAVRAACDAVTSLAAVADLGDQDALRVGALLLAGRLPVSAYASLASVYLRAKASGLADSEILSDVIIGPLESGGGIVAMHEKIDRGRAARAGAGRPPHAGPPAQPPGQAKDKPEKPDKPDKPEKPEKPAAKRTAAARIQALYACGRRPSQGGWGRLRVPRPPPEPVRPWPGAPA